MLGKRERSQVLMPRTTSMASLPSAAKQGRQATGDQPHVPFSSLPAVAVGMGAGGGGAGGVVPKDSGDLAGGKPTAFLKACGFCGRRLGPGKDTYIYMGEVAFCSQECREKRIEEDEQNYPLTSISTMSILQPGVQGEAPSVSGAGGSDQSGSGGETVAAA